ncbi:MAG: arsenite methyltransferase [Haloferacaceae archaeon]
MADADDGSELDPATRRRAVRDRYADVATDEGGCCSGDARCDDGPSADAVARRIGYSSADLDAVAGEANLGLGCGNPEAIAALEPGETVVDLGAGAGFDCFLAAREVGPSGRVIGVDMTPEMVEKARANAAENDLDAVEFRLGEIEHLPVADATADAVISNCVINLSPDKPQVFREAYRVLRPGGRLAVADVVATDEVPSDLRTDPGAAAGCVAGAATVDALERMLADAGFVEREVAPRDDGGRIVEEWDDDRSLGEFLAAGRITGRKPTE